MFVWLASYPKSGNTLVRSMLASYFFSDDGKFNFNLLNNILQFPYVGLFKKIGVNKKTGKKVKFFNLGSENKWEKFLNKDLQKKIEESFKDEMIELGYL